MLGLSLLSLISLATASPLKDYVKSLEARVDVTDQNLSDFQHYVQHAAAAYCNVKPAAGARITCSDDLCPSLQGDAVTVVNGFSGLVTGISGYVATDHARGEIVLSVRGSNNIRNFITDVVFAFAPCSFTSGCKLHAGFKAAWDEISRPATAAVTSALAANPTYRIITTGHSLGGAVATIAAVDLRSAGRAVDVYSYGSPRVGNDKFADFMSKQVGGEFRVTHTDDPVPRLPPIIFGYRHTTPEYWLSKDSSAEVYPLSDIRVCDGLASISCNGGTFGLNIPSHLQYFIAVSSCEAVEVKMLSASATVKTASVKTDSVSALSVAALDDVSNEELEARLNDWSQQDQDFVSGA